MKRLLLGIPLAAIGLGLLLLLVRSFARQAPVEERVASAERPRSHEESKSETASPAAGKGAAAATAEPPGTIHVLVQSRGKGFPKAKVKVTREETHQSMELETDDQGFQTLGNLPAGEYQIEGSVSHYVTKRVHTVVVSGKTSEVLLRLDPGARLEGRVFDPQGRPAPGAHLNLMNPDKEIFMTPALSTVSDAEGHYLIDGVPLEELHLYVYHPRYKAWWKKNMPFRDADFTVHQDVTLEEGSLLSGIVVDSDGRPVEGATLFAKNEALIVENSDRNGNFTIYGLDTGKISLKVQAKGYGTHYQEGLAPNSDGLVIRLSKAGSLKGKLLAASPPENFQIALFHFDPNLGQDVRLEAWSFSGTLGEFELRDLPPGRYRLGAWAEGWDNLEQPEIFIQEGMAGAPATIKMARKK